MTEYLVFFFLYLKSLDQNRPDSWVTGFYCFKIFVEDFKSEQNRWFLDDRSVDRKIGSYNLIVCE